MRVSSCDYWSYVVVFFPSEALEAGWILDANQDPPEQFSAGWFPRPAVLCSTDLRREPRRRCQTSSRSAAAEQSSVSSNSEKQIGNRISPNTHLIFQKWAVVTGCAAEQKPSLLLNALRNQLRTWPTGQGGPPAPFTWAPSSSCFPFSRNVY